MTAMGDKNTLQDMLATIASIPNFQQHWSRTLEQRLADADTCDDIIRAVRDNPNCVQSNVKNLINVVAGRYIANLMPYLENARRIVRTREGKKILLNIPAEDLAQP